MSTCLQSQYRVVATLTVSIFLLCSLKALSQEVSDKYIRYSSVKDPVLHAALERVSDLSPQEFRRPDVAADARLILDKVADGTLPTERILGTIERIVEGSAAAARPTDIPTLIVLARHKNKAIRDALASAQLITIDHPKELLLELILTAESQLPGDLTDTQGSQSKFNEFTSRITTFCTYIPFDQRDPAKQAVEHFLNLNDNPAIRQHYERVLRETLSEAFPRKVGPGTLEKREPIPEKAPQLPPAVNEPGGNTPPKQPKAPSFAAESSSAPWLAWSAVIVAAIGLLLLLLKKRK